MSQSTEESEVIGGPWDDGQTHTEKEKSKAVPNACFWGINSCVMDDTTKVQLLALTAAAGASLASFWLAKSKSTHTQSCSSSKSIQASSSSKNELAGKNGHFVPPFVGALDQGTSSTRFIVFDSRTNMVVSHQMELPPLYPQTGCVTFIICISFTNFQN